MGRGSGSGVAGPAVADDALVEPPGDGELTLTSTDSFNLPPGDEGSVMLDLRRGRALLASQFAAAVNPEVGAVAGGEA